MRQGTNPFKAAQKKIQAPHSITIGVLNCIPNKDGYFHGQFDALKLCLASLRAYADQPFDLLVVDNGSCNEVRQYLISELQAGRINNLLLNDRNLGKMNAQMQILQAASGELVFYSDGDIYHRPGWMQAHLDVWNAFPEAGLIGGIPIHHIGHFKTGATRAWVEEHRAELNVECGALIPEEWSRDFSGSIGAEFQAEKTMQDWRLTRAGVAAYVGASHMQFLIPRRAIGKLPRQNFQYALRQEETATLDRVLDREGFLRLSTDRPFVYHIGNAVTEAWLVDEFKHLVTTSTLENRVSRTSSRHWFWGRSKIRKALRKLSDWAFDVQSRYSP